MHRQNQCCTTISALRPIRLSLGQTKSNSTYYSRRAHSVWLARIVWEHVCSFLGALAYACTSCRMKVGLFCGRTVLRQCSTYVHCSPASRIFCSDIAKYDDWCIFSNLHGVHMQFVSYPVLVNSSPTMRQKKVLFNSTGHVYCHCSGCGCHCNDSYS